MAFFGRPRARAAIGVVAGLVLAPTLAAAQASAGAAAPGEGFVGQIIDAEIGGDERERPFRARPELYIQARFSQQLLANAEPAAADRNFQMTRIETRWAGRLSERVGAGLEIQFHPALDGHAEEMVNDAFVEFYATPALTIRAGQFIKPFGFDIQQSSADREYPERGMWAGYFFPGQRDRGVELRWDLHTASVAVGHMQLYVAALNGNRFFNDNDGRLDTVLRVRREFERVHLAVGGSAQIGSQIVPPTFAGQTGVRIVGLDAQYATAHVGVRAEWVHGTRPSTLLALHAEYTDAFAPHTSTDGLSTALLVTPDPRSQLYGRIDRLRGDPMTGRDVRALDVGYRRILSDAARLTIDYQWKNAPTVNDDSLNTRLQVTFGLEF